MIGDSKEIKTRLDWQQKAGLNVCPLRDITAVTVSMVLFSALYIEMIV